MTQPTLTTLASFSGSNGAYPDAALFEDAAGNLFGTTVEGGASSYGVVFELAQGAAQITALTSFTYGNGAYPLSSLTANAAGDLFGTADFGGSIGYGTVFELAKGATQVTVLTNFNQADGSYPLAGVVMDSAGNLFGTTEAGGSAGFGTVFELPAGATQVTTLASFILGASMYPASGLIADAAGNLFGTTELGGSANLGTIYELAKGANTITTLASFTGGNGNEPLAGLTEDAAGDLFGTTVIGGTANKGTVFELAKGASTITNLVSFTGSNGSAPTAGLVLDSAGDLFGTTAHGGSANYGTVFELAASATQVTTLVTFTGANGSFPASTLIADASGNLFGATYEGGSSGYGTVFKVTNTGYQVPSTATIIATSVPGGLALTNAVTTVTSAGSVSGTNGVSLPSGSMVSNSGTISGSAGYGVSIAGSGSVTNMAGGSIFGATYGVRASGDPASLVNAGSISSPNVGVELDGGGTFTNAAGGSVSGNYAVYANNTAATVVNAGTITSRTNPGSAVYLKLGGALTNQATGLITGATYGVFSGVAATVVNTGSISAATGVWLGGGGTLVNAGTIGGGAQAVHVEHNATLVIDPGAVFHGAVNGVGTGTRVVDLASAASAGTIGSIGTAASGASINGFGSVDVAAGASWTLAGSTAMVFLGGGGDSLSIGTGAVSITAGSSTTGADTVKLGAGAATLDIAKNLAASITITGFTANDTVNFTGFGAGAAITSLGSGQYQVGTTASHETLSITGISLTGHTTLS